MSDAMPRPSHRDWRLYSAMSLSTSLAGVIWANAFASYRLLITLFG